MPTSGKYGKVEFNRAYPAITPWLGAPDENVNTVVEAIRNWSVNETVTDTTTVHSRSGDAMYRFRGVGDWNGSWEQEGGLPPCFPGWYGTLYGFQSGWDTAPVGITAVGVQGLVIVTDIEISWGISENEPVSNTVTFEGNGAIASLSSVANTEGVYRPSRTCNRKARWTRLINDISSTPDTELEIPNVTSMTLRFTRPSIPFVNSSTECWTDKATGPLDCTFDITVQDGLEQLTNYPYLNDSGILQLDIDDTYCWDIRYMKINELSNFRADVTSGDIDEFTISGGLTSRPITALTDVLGSITLRTSADDVVVGTYWELLARGT